MTSTASTWVGMRVFSNAAKSMNFFKDLLLSRSYWLTLAVASAAMMATALYYQYVLGEEPCQVCIQARLWVVGFMLVATVMTLLPNTRSLRSLGNCLALACAIGLVERSWFLYQLENGMGDGSCEFQLGMPDWFAVDRWFPTLFEVRNLCSFTPEMLFGLSMAESLLLAAAGMVLTVLASLAATRLITVSADSETRLAPPPS